MEIIKKYGVVITVVLILLVLVFIRSFGINHFQNDAEKLAEPSISGSNIITPDQVVSLKGEKLVINLDKEITEECKVNAVVLNMSVDSILLKNNIRTIKRHAGPLLLCSSDPALAARIWMILSQMGISDIFILTSDNDNEEFKNKFRPDTLIRPEL
jgi:anti-anti-sigma regulatory factor